MVGPLDGVNIVEVSMFQQGPMAGAFLGDLGANVIKVETRDGGDPGRGFMRIAGAAVGDPSAPHGRNFYFENQNRNKRSIVLDLKNEKAMAIFLKLIDKADVFLTNMSIGAPDRLGIGYKTLQARNPRLIYAHASGWGRNGPDANALSFDYTGIARSGLMMSCGERDMPPAMMAPGMGDQIGGIVCAWSICAALYAREKTGKGQLVDTSLMGSIIALLGGLIAAPCIFGREIPRASRAAASSALYNHYQCSDGKWLALAHLQPDRYWSVVCKVLGIEELIDDPRFNSIEARGEHAKELVAIFDKKLASKTRDEWMEIFKQKGIIYAPIQSLTEVANDPQALANDYIIRVDHSLWGKTKVIGFPWIFSETPASWRREAPELGQHTEEILLELGYTWEDIVKLKDEKAII